MTNGEYTRCPICNEWGFLNASFMPHRCKPAWECRMENGDDDYWITVRARNAEEAAEKFGEHHDFNGAEYDICNGRETLMALVRAAGSEAIERWEVSGEMVPSYSAEKVVD